MPPDRARGSPLALGAAALLLAAYAAAALGSGLDRMGARNPLLGERAPAPLAAMSHAPRAMLAAREGRFAEAEALARRAIAKAPFDPSSAGLLGTALLGQQKFAEADRAFRVSGQLGWRDAATQVYWMRIAAETGDWAIAAQRADAILRIDPAQTRNPQVTGPFEADPAGRAALVARMREAPGWREGFFRTDPASTPESLAARAEMLEALAKDGAADCGVAADFASRLARAGAIGRSFAIWSDACASGDPGLLRDGNFARAANPPASPFEWGLVPSGAMTVRRESDGLAISSRAAFPRTLARQRLVLPTGQFRLSWRETPVRSGSRVVPIVGCVADRGSRPEPRRAADGRIAAVFSVDAACEGHWLSLMIAAGPGETKLGDLRLERL